MGEPLTLHGDTRHAHLILQISDDLQDQLYFAELNDEGQIKKLTPEHQFNKQAVQQIAPDTYLIPPHLMSGRSFVLTSMWMSSGQNYTGVNTSGEMLRMLSIQHSGSGVPRLIHFDDGDPLL